MSTFKKSLFILKEYNAKIIFLVFLIFVSTFLDLLSLGMMLPLLNLLISDNYVNYIEKFEFLSFLKLYTKNELFFLSCISLIIAFSLKALFMIFLNIYKNNLIYKITVNLTNKLTKKYLYSQFKLFVETNSSTLLRNIVSDVVSFSGNTFNAIVFITIDLLLIISIIIFFLNYDFITTIMIISIILLIFIIYFFSFKKILITWSVEKLKFDRLRYKYLNEMLNAIKEIKVFKSENYFFNKFKKSNDIHFKVNSKQQTVTALPRIIFEFISILILTLIIYIFLKSNKPLDELLIILGLFAISSYRILPTITRLLVSLQSLKSSIAPLENLFLELTSNKYQDLKSFDKKELDFNNLKTLELENISFKYNEKTQIFKSLNYKFEIGNIYGVLGESGSGKTTLIDIICGLTNPDKGNLKINNNIISENIFKNSGIIGYVPQEVYLNDETIKSNIVFSDEEVNELNLKKAIEDAQLNNLISDLIDGVETQVGERGSQISGGQKQRIGIARALYKKFPIILMDEPTSSLDTETEEKFLESLSKIKLNKIIIIVSHRKSTFKICDKVLEVKNYNLREIK